MQKTKYVIGKDFEPVLSKYIDQRLIEHICNPYLPIEAITSNVNTILIYQQFVRNSDSTTLCLESQNTYGHIYKPMMIYGTSDFPLYNIKKNTIEDILGSLPLQKHIANCLVEDFGFSLSVDYQKYQDTNLWNKIFM